LIDGLKEALADCLLISGVEVEPYADDARPQHYIVRDGWVNLRADYNPPLQNRRAVTCRGAVEERPNPAFEEGVRRGRIPQGVPAHIYVQKIYDYIVSRETIEGVAEVMLRFTVEHEGERSQEAIALREGLRRSFVRETIEPRATEIREERREGPARDAEGPIRPVLRQDEIWSKYMLEDWARGEALTLAIVRILRLVASYPDELIVRARQFEAGEDWELAANYWGICLEYIRRVNAGPDVRSDYFRVDNPPPYLAEDFRRNADLQEALHRLSEGQVWEGALRAALRFLEE
jgi:hypothetical protein